MKHIVLKETNLTLSRVGFGCGPLGSREWGNYDQKETMSAVSKAFELGINYFDTADVYGLGTSEELLSKALGSNRHEAVISTKFGVNWSSKNKDLRAETFYDLSPGRVKEALEESLRRLRIDSVPLYFMHWPDPKTPLQETLEVLESLISQGKVQYIGLSNFSLEQIKEVNKNLKVSAIQVQHSLIDQDLSTELVDYCKLNNINLISYGSLAQGLLSGKYDKHFEFNEDDCRNRLPHFHGETLEKHLPLIRKIKSIALKYKISSSQVALRWALEEPAISSVISGIKTINQLEDNYGCLDWEIDESDYDFFKRTQ